MCKSFHLWSGRFSFFRCAVGFPALVLLCERLCTIAWLDHVFCIALRITALISDAYAWSISPAIWLEECIEGGGYKNHQKRASGNHEHSSRITNDSPDPGFKGAIRHYKR